MRLIGQPLSDRLGQSLVIENRPGAASNIATDAVVHAPADGYTLLVLSRVCPDRRPEHPERLGIGHDVGLGHRHEVRGAEITPDPDLMVDRAVALL